ncbi:MAG: hypothetical protein L0Y35_00355 [Flammeovirgaceae bacterium]|nr:hypothetical protein [Flammeovirgaceae bacterium]
MNQQTKRLIRKSHRYLGVFIGIQFIFWTSSGLYFSWSDIDEIHGDHLRGVAPSLSKNLQVISPSEAIKSIQNSVGIDSIHEVRLVRILDKPVYQIAYFKGHSGEGSHVHVHYALADASTGILRTPLTQNEAIETARGHIQKPATLAEVKYLDRVEGDHEYREKPLPAWAVTFSDPDCTVYVAAELGTFQSIRHNSWRIFDFLWMTHTMDYETRDDFNNIILRSFSILGLITVLSGFLLYTISSPTFQKYF